jgi:hypothetical protein
VAQHAELVDHDLTVERVQTVVVGGGQAGDVRARLPDEQHAQRVEPQSTQDLNFSTERPVGRIGRLSVRNYPLLNESRISLFAENHRRVNLGTS